MKPLVIYHADCPDGFGAAFVAWLKFGDKADYFAADHKRDTFPELRLSQGREVYILDYGYAKDQMVYLFTVAARVVWLDHHKSSFLEWAGAQWMDHPHGIHQAIGNNAQHTVILNKFKSGAMLTWEYFHPNIEVPMFIRLIDDYDRWQFKLEGAKSFHKVMEAYKPWSFEKWARMLMHILKEDVPYFSEMELKAYIAEGEALLRIHDQQVQSMSKLAMKCVVPNYNVDADIIADHREEWELPYEQAVAEMAERHALVGLAANCPSHLTDDVGHVLATQCGTYGLLWYMLPDGKVKCSLRSNGDYDVEAIAKVLGGGGSLNAAGFVTTMPQLLEWLK